jgi:hypothetical protein
MRCNIINTIVGHILGWTSESHEKGNYILRSIKISMYIQSKYLKQSPSIYSVAIISLVANTVSYLSSCYCD